jgi:hypothetical protein
MSLLTLPPNSSSDRHRLLHNRNPLRRLKHSEPHKPPPPRDPKPAPLHPQHKPPPQQRTNLGLLSWPRKHGIKFPNRRRQTPTSSPKWGARRCTGQGIQVDGAFGPGADTTPLVLAARREMGMWMLLDSYLRRGALGRKTRKRWRLSNWHP